ncbi:cancer-associated 1 protein-like isoform X2, partial [Clarias magur]
MEKSVLEEMKTSSPRMAIESGAGVRYSSQLAYGCITSWVWFLISSAVNTAEAVIVPLKDGVSSLNRVYEALIKADVDPVTGPAMMIGGGVELDQAGRAVSMAKEEVKKSETEVNKYGSKVPEYESKISQIKCDISQKDEKLKQTREGIGKAKKQIASVAEFQKKARSAIQLLGVLSGRANAAELQTRRFILQEPVVKVMDDVMKATEQITGNELLNSNDMPRLI